MLIITLLFAFFVCVHNNFTDFAHDLTVVVNFASDSSFNNNSNNSTEYTDTQAVDSIHYSWLLIYLYVCEFACTSNLNNSMEECASQQTLLLSCRSIYPCSSCHTLSTMSTCYKILISQVHIAHTSDSVWSTSRNLLSKW